MSPTNDRREDLLDLLATRATERLGLTELGELETRLREFPDVDPDQFDLAAAATYVVLASDQSEALPADLLDRLKQRARVQQTAGTRQPPARRERSAFAWGVAAAAVAALILLLIPPKLVAPERDRQALLAAAETLRLDWSPTEDELATGGASGDVVWHSARQEGYMLFERLAANNPEEGQYQLWIFDRAQDERFPVDGGVFDVRAGGPTIVAIDPKLEIVEPYLFAITYEKPGGVVVSSRERLVLLAQKDG